MKYYRCSNGRMIARASNGRFRKTTLADLGIPNSALNNGKKLVCSKCGTSFIPLMKTADKKCWKCGSQMHWTK